MEISDLVDMEMRFWNELVIPNTDDVEKSALLSEISTICFNAFTQEEDKIDVIWRFQKKYPDDMIDWERYKLHFYLLKDKEFEEWEKKREEYYNNKFENIHINERVRKDEKNKTD